MGLPPASASKSCFNSTSSNEAPRPEPDSAPVEVPDGAPWPLVSRGACCDAPGALALEALEGCCFWSPVAEGPADLEEEKHSLNVFRHWSCRFAPRAAMLGHSP